MLSPGARLIPIVLLALWRLGAVHVPLFTAFAGPSIALRVKAAKASLIVTDPATIRRLTEHGFGTLCRRIRDIYLGSYHALGNNAMMYAGWM